MSSNILLIILTALISLKGFGDHIFQQKAIFYPWAIRERGEWYRFLSSGFIHAGWLHLVVNMYVLYLFGNIVEPWLAFRLGNLSHAVYIGFYLLAVIVSSLFTYFRQRDNALYRSLGASGGVSAVVFSAILIFPDMQLALIFLPFWLPAWIFGILYLLYSVFMSRAGGTNINHDAHLFGALFGILVTTAVDPSLFLNIVDKIKHLI